MPGSNKPRAEGKDENAPAARAGGSHAGSSSQEKHLRKTIEGVQSDAEE